MATRVDPKLMLDLEKFGAHDARKCYQCGTCTAVCPHADELWSFPRKPIQTARLGFADRLDQSLEPWLCYYCGDCSERCPRGAEPGEMMMSLRRWLTSRYDITGLSRLFYRSGAAEVLAMVLVGLAAAGGFLAYGLLSGHRLGTYDGPHAFLPWHVIHRFDWSMAGVLTFFLAINSSRMWWWTTGSGPRVKVPLSAYFKKLPLIPLQFFTQSRYAACGRKRSYLVHLGLMLSYVTLFVLIMFFLHRMQSGPAIDWRVHGLGYLAGLGLLVTVIVSLRGRATQAAPLDRRSHESDWIFLVMLLLTALTGFTQHVLHRVGLDVAANVAYVVHLGFVVPLLVLEVPFGKWSHMVYRPLALYLAEVQREALAVRGVPARQPAELPSGIRTPIPSPAAAEPVTAPPAGLP